MKQFFNHEIWSTHALLVGRLLVGSLFLLAGLQKLQGIDQVAQYIAGAGLPLPVVLAWASMLFEIGAGAAIISGKYFKEAAILLALFTIFVSFPFHGPSTWADNPMQKMMFMKNLAIAGGLLFMAAHGAGNTFKLKV